MIGSHPDNDIFPLISVCECDSCVYVTIQGVYMLATALASWWQSVLLSELKQAYSKMDNLGS